MAYIENPVFWLILPGVYGYKTRENYGCAKVYTFEIDGMSPKSDPPKNEKRLLDAAAPVVPDDAVVATGS